MSGPVIPPDEAPFASRDTPSQCDLQVIEGRGADVGGFRVDRLLPRRSRRMVGAWCFVDHLGPGQADGDGGLNVGPHPHIGLQTVTWLVSGAVLHRDSLGSEQVIQPGQLNLMTAGGGVSHSEETRGVHVGALHGVQLWVAQPTATREGQPAFEHHAQLPAVDLERGVGTVIIGKFAGVASPARRDTDHLAIELDLRPGPTSVPLQPSFEHAIVALGPGASLGGRRLGPGNLGYLGVGRDELVVDAVDAVRVLLIGGEPFPEQLLMWWNYVARTREEITEAHRAWSTGSGRFGHVRSPLARIDTPGPPWPAG